MSHKPVNATIEHPACAVSLGTAHGTEREVEHKPGSGLFPVVEGACPPKAPSRGTARIAASRGPRIAIEGPLRVGKSTLANLLAERLGATVLREPETNPFLPRFYKGEPGMAFATQVWFLRQRVTQLQQAERLTGAVVADYILEKDKLFAHLTLSDSELTVYRDYFAAHTGILRPSTQKSPASSSPVKVAAPMFRPDLVVYLRADPAVLRERRRRKALPEERSIGREYTREVCAAYDHFFARYSASRLLVVDTSAIDFVHNTRERDILLDRILAPVHGCEHFTPLAEIA
jgi:deoxyguanosine kinase